MAHPTTNSERKSVGNGGPSKGLNYPQVCSRMANLVNKARVTVVYQFELGGLVRCSRPLMKSAKNTMLAQNMLAMSGGQGDLPWAFASLQTPYMRAALPPTKMR